MTHLLSRPPNRLKRAHCLRFVVIMGHLFRLVGCETRLSSRHSMAGAAQPYLLPPTVATVGRAILEGLGAADGCPNRHGAHGHCTWHCGQCLLRVRFGGCMLLERCERWHFWPMLQTSHGALHPRSSDTTTAEVVLRRPFSSERLRGSRPPLLPRRPCDQAQRCRLAAKGPMDTDRRRRSRGAPFKRLSSESVRGDPIAQRLRQHASNLCSKF